MQGNTWEDSFQPDLLSVSHSSQSLHNNIGIDIDGNTNNTNSNEQLQCYTDRI